MFYVNNKQVLGIFLNGNNYNYMSFGLGKIIPENRSAYFAYINLAQRYLSQYRVEYGNIQSGYDNFPIARLDYPVNGIFHSPLTYYYGGNIVPTKNIPVYINNGYYAIRGTVYNDINVSGNIVYFATNTDFQGHNVNTYIEGFGSSQSYFDSTVMSNCSNFHLKSLSRFSKGSQPTLYNCNNFSGWFNFVCGDDGTRYPGFRGFLEGCKDGVFNIDCTNMHGGGSDANVRNYFNFSGIHSCNNIKLNIKGSSWQAWVHPHCKSDKCNITTRGIVPGFDCMYNSNFNIYLPSNANVEKSARYPLLSNSYKCNYNLNALDSNLFNYRGEVEYNAFFDGLNNCNLNLQVNNTTSFDHSFGNNFRNCNIVFDNIKADLSAFVGWYGLYNCNISGNVEAAESVQEFIGHSDGINININAAKSSRILTIWRCNNVKGNLVAGDMTYIGHSNYSNLNVYRGRLCLNNINNSYFRVNNTTFNCRSINDTEIRSDGGTSITGLDNCYNLKLSGLTFNTTALGDSCLLENVYNSNIKFGTANTYYHLWCVENCIIDGFPRSLTYVNKCVFLPFNMRQVGLYNSEVGTWNNVWPHNKIAGIRSTDNISNCRIYANGWRTDGNTYFNNVNNMQTSFGNYYNGFVTANLPIYNMNIKLNVDCNTLNLGMFQAGPPHGFQNATISANAIYAKGSETTAYVQVNCDTKIYCENFCNVCFQPYVADYNNVLQPVILINNYDHANSSIQFFYGGLTRIGRQSTRIYPLRFSLYSGACVFINNAALGSTIVDNSFLYLGSNVTLTNGINVTNGGRVRNAANLTNDDIRFIDRGQLCWNLRDYGPWGTDRLIDFCTGV